MGFGAPFVSGKDSLNNEFKMEDGTEVNIPATLLISAITLVDDINKCVTMDFKKAGNVVYLVGETFDELGGSHFYSVNGEQGVNVPKVNIEVALATATKIHNAINAGLVRSAHDCSEGGFVVAASEMAFAGGMGVECDIDAMVCEDGLSNTAKLFSESNSRYVIEVESQNAKAFETALQGTKFAKVGVVTDTDKVVIKASGKDVVCTDIATLKKAWQKPLAW